MKETIAACGLFCGVCKSYLKGKCLGCKNNVKAKWCGIRSCVIGQNISSCADCKKEDLKKCRIFNNLIGKIFGFIFNSDRAACIEKIKTAGYENFEREMSENKVQTIKRKK